MSGKYELGYWDIKGLAAPIRMALYYANRNGEFPFIDKTYTLTANGQGGWNNDWAPTYKSMAESQHAFPNLPYLILPDGSLTLVQSSAILRYIGRVAKLEGDTETERSRCDEAIEQFADFRKEIVDASYGRLGNYEKALNDILLTGTFPFALKGLANQLARTGGVYIAGPNITVADFYVYDVVVLIDKHSKGSLLPSQYPTIAEYKARIEALPGLAQYFAAPCAKFAHNNKMAVWGGKPDE